MFASSRAALIPPIPPPTTQGRIGDRHVFVLQGLEIARLGNRRGHDLLGLFRCPLVIVGVDPAVLVTDIGHFEEVFVQSGLLHRRAEDRLMGPRRTGGDNHPIHDSVTNILLHHLLPRIRTHEQILARNHHVRERFREISYCRNVDDAGNIGTAMTDVHTDFCHTGLLVDEDRSQRGARLFGSGIRPPTHTSSLLLLSFL